MLVSLQFTTLSKIMGWWRVSFPPHRGLRQSDTLSPFLLTLVTDALSYLPEIGRIGSTFKGLEIGINRLEVMHLQYAYDTILFLESNIYGLTNLKVIYCFEEVRVS